MSKNKVVETLSFDTIMSDFFLLYRSNNGKIKIIKYTYYLYAFESYSNFLI